MGPLRALIVDDEPVARDALRALLAEFQWSGEVREARDGSEALEAFREYQPHLVFLDVQLPVMSGIDALERSELAAAVVFTTAQDDAAITAFELGAIDYLRKPFGRDRFALALERANAQISTMQATAEPGRVATVGERLRQLREARRPLQRIFVRDRRNVIAIDAREIVRCEADDDYVAIHSASGGRHHAYINLRDLAAELDPAHFVRVHRSHVVNMDFVSALAYHDPNRVEVQMKDGTRIVASRSGTQLLRARTK
jgi:two-component system LytT family response regulator